MEDLMSQEIMELRQLDHPYMEAKALVYFTPTVEIKQN